MVTKGKCAICHRQIDDHSGAELKACNQKLWQIREAATDMYEALNRLLKETSILDNEQCDHDVGICWCSYKNARFEAQQALRKAEGK